MGYTPIFLILLLLGIILDHGWSEELHSCYDQHCVHTRSGWVCMYAENQKQTCKPGKDICFERDKKGKALHRFCWSTAHLNQSEIVKMKEEGRYCRPENKRKETFCYCGSANCNDFFQLPDNFKADPEEYEQKAENPE